MFGRSLDLNDFKFDSAKLNDIMLLQQVASLPFEGTFQSPHNHPELVTRVILHALLDVEVPVFFVEGEVSKELGVLRRSGLGGLK